MTGENEHGEHRETSAEVHGGTIAAAGAGEGADNSPCFTLEVAEGGTSTFTYSRQGAGSMSLIFGSLGEALGWPAGGPQQNNFGTMVFYTNPAPMTLAEWQALGGINTWSPPDPVEHAGIELGEVIAWRCWQMCRDTGLLTSMSAPNIWMPGEPLKADVDESGHGTMGVHAYKLAADAMSDYGRGGRMARPCVVGRVMLWGEIVEHENGYRAEFGIPVSLEYIVPVRWRTRRWLRSLKAQYDRPDLLTAHQRSVHGLEE